MSEIVWQENNQHTPGGGIIGAGAGGAAAAAGTKLFGTNGAALADI